MDTNGEYPSIDAISHLLPLFQLHFSYFFPLLPPRIESYAASPPHLINAICALAARYSPTYASSRRGGPSGADDENTASHIWASKAKEQVSQRLAISDEDVVQTLLMISWYEFGQDRDSVSHYDSAKMVADNQGLWMYVAHRRGKNIADTHKVFWHESTHGSGLR